MKRSILLPPYLSQNQYFVDFVDAIDEQWLSNVDNKIEVLRNLRNMWIVNHETEAKIEQGELLNESNWTQPEREILVKQVNFLGMKLQSAGLITDPSYQRLSRFLGLYWFEKGTKSFIEFMNYCLDINFQLDTLWSIKGGNKYNGFFGETIAGNPPGTPIWDGGTYFPTTHVTISTDVWPTVDFNTLSEFFYEIANYNLVLHSMVVNLKVPVVDDLEKEVNTAEIVAIGMYEVRTIRVSNF